MQNTSMHVRASTALHDDFEDSLFVDQRATTYISSKVIEFLENSWSGLCPASRGSRSAKIRRLLQYLHWIKQIAFSNDFWKCMQIHITSRRDLTVPSNLCHCDEVLESSPKLSDGVCIMTTAS